MIIKKTKFGFKTSKFNVNVSKLNDKLFSYNLLKIYDYVVVLYIAKLFEYHFGN